MLRLSWKKFNQGSNSKHQDGHNNAEALLFRCFRLVNHQLIKLHVNIR